MDGRLREQLEAALADVFNEDTLRRWLRYSMDTRLDEVVGDGLPLRTTIFQLVDWAEREGRLDEFIQKAVEGRDNPQLIAVGEKWRQPKPAVDQKDRQPKPVDAGALRRAIAGAFTLAELELVCAAVEDELRKAGRDESVSLDVIGATGGLQNAVLALVRYLDRRGHLPALITVVRRDRPGLI